MDMFSLVQCITLLILTYLTFKHIFIHRLKNLPPSPPLCLPIIGHLYLLKKPFHRSLARLAARYGPVLYLQLGTRSTLVISSQSAVEECLVRGNAFLDRPKLLPAKHPTFNYTPIPWVPYGAHLHNLRRIATVEILSPQRLQILSGVRADVAQTFIRRMMKEIRQNGGPIEMKSALFGFTLDNMMRMLVGKSGYEEGDHKQEIKNDNIGLKRFQELVEESFRRNGITNLEDFLPILKLLNVLPGMKSNKEMIQKLNAEKEVFTRGLMEEHRKMEGEGKLSEAQKNSMLQVLLSLQQKDPQQYSDEMIGSLLLTLFQAGTDTSSSTTVWALSLLLNHPQVLKKAQDEMDTNVGHKRLVEESDKNNLPYIQCIIDETFRMFPTAQLAIPYESRVDCSVGGYHVPRGSMLLYNIWAIHNDPKIWDEPRKFKPERFLESSKETRHGHKLLTFGAGKRICPGEQLGSRMVWLIVAILIQCFEWERVGDELVDLKEGNGLSLTKVEPLLAKCCPRPCMMNLLSQLQT